MSAAERVSTAKRAEGSKGMSKRCERTSTRMGKSQSTQYSVLSTRQFHSHSTHRAGAVVAGLRHQMLK